MTKTTIRLTAAVETYFAALWRMRASGGATGERSSYAPLANLLNAVGATLKPKVFCVGELADQGAGHPDFGLYAAKQLQKGRPRQGQVSERGVVEVKSVGDDAWLTAGGNQASRYWRRYRLVLVTNTRDFVLLGEDAVGRPAKLETFRFISNYSWLDGLSFTGMRERFLEAFDAVRIDCLNGDKYKTGKVAPDGSPDPSIFSTEGDPVGIQVGTAIATLVRKADLVSAGEVGFRHLWGQTKRAALLQTAEAAPDVLYNDVSPVLPLGLPFTQTAVSTDWFDWPALPDLFPVSFPGVKTSRDGFLVDTDLDRLRARVDDYFDNNLSHEEIARRYPGVMKTTARFDARKVRNVLLALGGPDEVGFVRLAYRPFDTRWLYWEAETKLLDEKRADYKPHVFEGNLWLSAAQHLRKDAEEPQACFTRHIGSLHLIERGALMFPAYLLDDGLEISGNGAQHRPNLSGAAQRYLDRLGLGVKDLFHHVLATVHDPAYREANAGALRMEWPRIPLPGWPDGAANGAAEALAESAERGRELAHLLDSDTPVPSVAEGFLRPEVAAIAVPATIDGRNMTGDNFALTSGWGHFGSGDAVMPGQGRVVERVYTSFERAALGDAAATLGEATFDVYLNARAYWRNVPAAVWTYRLGGYQVLKKWLSYREGGVLGRALSPEEVQHFTDTARRIAGILLRTVR